MSSGSGSNDPLSRSFFYRTHLLWNKLPFGTREIVSPSTFKSEVTKYLWESILTKEHSDSFLVDSPID